MPVGCFKKNGSYFFLNIIFIIKISNIYENAFIIEQMNGFFKFLHISKNILYFY